jgi:2-amino-4-hydroxy-6-hydroxymethyldihydropteridine diphosphokinase
MSESIAYVGAGTNVGDRAVNLRTAVAKIAEHTTVRACSSVYETEPVGYAEQREFWNMVIEVSTSLSPKRLLAHLISIEESMGRQRTFRNAPRIIDLDVLMYGDVVMDEPGLDLPHPRMTERAFVLMPLVELNPGLVHPVTREKLVDVLRNGRFEKAAKIGALQSVSE